MKTFITGATGFIGTHLVRRLAQLILQLVKLSKRGDMANTSHTVPAMGLAWKVTNIHTSGVITSSY